MENRLYFGKNFIDLYLDSLILLLASDKESVNNLYSTNFISFCRGSIISAIISVECAANCCLEVLDIPKPIKDEIDKLDFIAKLNYFNLQYPTPQRMDFSKVEVGRIRELKRIRNDYVHPKVLRGRLSFVSDNIIQARLEKKDYPLTRISCDSTTWDLPVAVKVSKVVADFYNYYFMEVCGFSKRITGAILVGDERYDRDNPSGIALALNTFSEVESRFGIKIDFLPVATHPPN